MKIVFMGSPAFAVASLHNLHRSSHEIVAVVTAADKPAGRGRKIQMTAVKEYALEHKLPILQPLKLKDPEFLEELASYGAELFAVVAFRMLPESVWSMPVRGTINLHASLLPRYRGAAPINWAIINGDEETGLSTFYINEEIDKGAILYQKRLPIAAEDDAGSLHDKMMVSGADLLLETVDAISEGKAIAKDQGQSSLKASHASKLDNENRRIDWAKSSKEIMHLIRGLSPYPSAFSLLINEKGEELLIKFYKADVSEGHTLDPGAWESDFKSHLFIGTGDGSIELKELQVAGKKRMNTQNLLNGWAPEAHSRFI